MGEIRSVRSHGHSGEVLAEPQRVPELRISPAHSSERLREPFDRRRHAGGARGGAALHRSPRVPRVSATAEKSARQCRRFRRVVCVWRHARRAADQSRRHGLRLHGRLHGIGGRRENRAVGCALARAEVSAHRRLRVRRRAHAGGRPVADADGESGRGPRPARGAAHTIYLDPDQSHDRRRERELRDARRRNSRGAWGRHRLRGPACHQTDARSGSARGLSDERVPTRPRDARHGGAPQAAQGDRRLASASYVGSSGRRGVGARIAALEEALNFLFARTAGVYKLGLERTNALLEALGNPHRAYPVLHVAGTNGKGSSLATAEALLRGRGLRVGKYTSPHLVGFRERVLVSGVPIEADAVVEFVERWTPLVEELGATFFEATTALAFDAFARAEVDIALIETGLGGRLDSTNVVDPNSAGVTSIGWDHMEYLGHSLTEIAMEKAGIFKPGRAAVIGEPARDIRELLKHRAMELGAAPFLVADEISIE